MTVKLKAASAKHAAKPLRNAGRLTIFGWVSKVEMSP